MEQRSEEWFAARLGKVTASRVHEIIATGKNGGFATSRATYMNDLLVERMTGKRAESFSSASMLWGEQTEDEARRAYEFQENVDVERVGFIDHPVLKMSGASPDGIMSDRNGVRGILEIKCPNSSTHLEYIKTGILPTKYITQIHWQAACAKAWWADFVSYDPRILDVKNQLYIKTVEIDYGVIGRLERAVEQFLCELSEQVEWFKRRVA